MHQLLSMKTRKKSLERTSCWQVDKENLGHTTSNERNGDGEHIILRK